jgi:threonine aldolase
MRADAAVDLRSDTVTLPTRAMRAAMAAAEVGDDVYGEDPTVRRLEEAAATRLGHEAALFVPTGTMGNQIAIHVHTSPGCDVLLHGDSHIYRYELGAMAAWSGAVPRVVGGDLGHPDPGEVERAIAPDVYYLARTALLALENTQNQAGGTLLPATAQPELVRIARARGIPVHLDGARIFNAAAAGNADVRELAAGVDSVMFCLSKGLGAPVGSLLCGSSEFVREARVVRKRMGGGMRQSGILAAAGLYALDHHVDRLHDDHARAARLAGVLAGLALFDIDPAGVRTNIVVAGVRPPWTVDQVVSALRGRGVLAGPMGPGRIRFVTHLDVDDGALDRTIRAVRDLSRD